MSEIAAQNAGTTREINLALGMPEEILCPTSGRVCPYRQRIVDIYSEKADFELDAMLPEDMRNENNAPKMQLRLGETKVIAMAIGCEGPNEANKCPTGLKIQQSPIRKGIVGKLIKNVLKF